MQNLICGGNPLGSDGAMVNSNNNKIDRIQKDGFSVLGEYAPSIEHSQVVMKIIATG